MFIRNLVIMIFLPLSVGCSKQASKWVDVGQTSDMHFYIEKHIETGTKKESPFVGVKMLWDFNQPQSRPEGEVYKSVAFMILIDCSRKMAADFSYKNYSGAMASGAVVASGERDLKEAERDLKPIQNSATNAVADLVCTEIGKGDA